MNIYMLETRSGLNDDLRLMRFERGLNYRMAERTAVAFLNSGYAILIFDCPTWSIVMSSRFKARRVTRLSEPAVEPLSLSEVKTFLRIDHNNEDKLLNDIVKAALIVAEEQTGRSMITQSWRISYDDCPPQALDLTHGPIQSITSVKVIAEDGSETTIDSSHYHVNSVQDLIFNTVPSGHQVQIDYVGGFGDAASDVPRDITQAMLMHIAHLYEHRDAMTPPLASQLNYANHRELRL